MGKVEQTLCLFAGIILCAAVNGQVLNPCANRVNGTFVQINCLGYKECQDFKVVDVPCATGEVFERKSMSCVDKTKADTACGDPIDCFNKTGRFADTAKDCETYFICITGISYGRLYCPPTTYYSEPLSLCAFKYQVPPPCGTYVAP